MTKTTETTPALYHKIDSFSKDGHKLLIHIKLSDDCKNGHADFSITGDIFLKDKPLTDKNWLMGGCIHEEILAVHPELELFVLLHLADTNGAPMYAVENGFYHAKSGEMDINNFMKYMRCSKVEAEGLMKAEDKTVFAYMLYDFGIIESWKKDAAVAIQKLEEWTGKKFKDQSTRLQKIISNPEIKEIRHRIKTGYYSAANIKKRDDKAREQAKNKTISEITDEWHKAVTKANDEYNVKMAIVGAGLSIDNFIYYDHTKEGVFNWLDYNKKITEHEFNAFLKSVKKKDLPKGIKFSMK